MLVFKYGLYLPIKIIDKSWKSKFIFQLCILLSAGDFWGFNCEDCLSTLACYSPADLAEKDRCDIVEILPFMLFFPFRSFSLFFPYVSKRPLLLFFIFIDIVFVCVNGLFSRRSRRLRRGMQQGCIISQTKDSQRECIC